MIKSQKKHLAFKGGITPFLSIIFVLLLSLVGVLLQSVSVQTSKNVKRAEMTLAVENIFAEYQVELLKKYDIFAREGSQKKEWIERLEFYGITQSEIEVSEFVLLSDLNGEAFYRQAIEGVGELEETEDGKSMSTEIFEEAKGEKVELELEQILGEKNVELPTENNPIEAIRNIKALGILSVVYPKQEELSNRSIASESLPSHRKLETGKGSFIKKTKETAIGKFALVKYLTEHFPCVLNAASDGQLVYEAEYLLGGKTSDKENLEIAAEKIMAIRMGINYGYLLTDEEKKMEAEAVAIGLSSLIAAPEAAEVIKQAILLAWAYGESLVDVRQLLQEKKIPVIKTSKNWQLALSNLFQLKEGQVTEGNCAEEGVTYEEYLKILLLMEKKEVLCMRALDLIEMKTGVRVDQCLVGASFKSTCALKRNITYTFQTEYQYQ